MASPKNAADYDPFLKDQGIPNVCGAFVPGVSMQAKQITQGGASPFQVTFANYGMSDMADASYVVVVGGQTAGAPKVVQSSILPTGFQIAGGGAGEVLHVMVCGALKGQTQPAS